MTSLAPAAPQDAQGNAPGNTPGYARVRTRFAPSPTGYLHVGSARTALYAWAFARHHGGDFILRIEDTDVERSTPEAVQAILDGMAWLGLNPDEGPFYQMQRMERYREVIAQMLADGRAYHCYASPAELEAMREAQKAAGDKPRYDGRWRPERAAAAGVKPPADGRPVVRFRNPDDGVVQWDDGVKGSISIANAELDDLIIARADGTPTYNFCVVVDDWDMGITHVIRGDDHINNTPRQINILRALGGAEPVYAHLPMIHGPDGEKLSKRHGAVSVLQYETDGYLPEGLLNYLARLGWSHGDDELFAMPQFTEWFGLDHCSKSAAQFDFEKLLWVNQHHMKMASGERLAALVAPRLEAAGLGPALRNGPALAAVCDLLKDRTPTLVALAQAAEMFYVPVSPEAFDASAQSAEVMAALRGLAAGLTAQPTAGPAEVSALLKDLLKAHGLKMPQLAMPLRLLLLGRTETPAIDRVIALLGPSRVAQVVAARV